MGVGVYFLEWWGVVTVAIFLCMCARWHLHTGKAYKLERNATTGKLRRRGHQDSSEEEEDIATDSDDDDEANE